MGKLLKRLGVLATSVCLLVGCNGTSKEIEEIDGMIYSFIVAKIEGNDDTLADLLMDDAEGIIVPGRHAFPGAADKLGENYTIIRYDDHKEEGIMVYKIDFYRPPTDTYSYYNVVVMNDEEKGWLIYKNSSVDEDAINQYIGEEEGTTVHEAEGR